MKRMLYIMGSIGLIIVLMYGMGLSYNTGFQVLPSESHNEKDEIMLKTDGSPVEPDDTLTQTEEKQPLTKEELVVLPSPGEILTQQQESSQPSGRTTIPFPENGIPVLMYHSISYNRENTLCVSEEQLREEMEWLHNNGYHTMNIDELNEALTNNGPIPENPVLITFDDGYADNYTAAWPILKQYGFTATFFIITENTTGMNWEQLAELISYGNSIGSHTVNHCNLPTLSVEQQKKEIGDSKQILEEKLGIPIRAFCFPFGEYDHTMPKLLTESGYSLGFTTESGRVHAGDEPFLLKRVRIWGGMTSLQFQKQVTGI